MKDLVFIGWQGKNGLAAANKLKLVIENNDPHIVAQVGGDSGNTTGFLSITDTVIKQMDSCSGAILLLTKNDEKKASPNLLFEYGYLLNRFSYRNKRPLLAFVDIDENDQDKYLPSDLKNIWKFVPDSLGQEDVFDEIANSYFEGQKGISNSQLDFLIKVNEISNLITEFDKKKNISLYHYAIYLIYYLQTCYYAEKFDDIEEAIKKIDYDSPAYLQISKNYCEISISFYKRFFEHKDKPLLLNEVFEYTYKYTNLKDRIDSMFDDQLHEEVYTLLKYFIHEHIGFVNMFYLLSKEEKDLEPEPELVHNVMHHAAKALKWINHHIGNTAVDELCMKNFTNTDAFFDVLFASHAAGQLANIHSVLYDMNHQEEDLEKMREYCDKTVLYRSFIQNNYDSYLQTNLRASETIKLDYYNSITQQYQYLQDGYDKELVRRKTVRFLNINDEKHETYEDFINVIKQRINYRNNPIFTVAVCGPSGIGKTTLVNELSSLLGSSCRTIIEKPEEIPFLNTGIPGDAFKSQIMFYLQNLTAYRRALKEEPGIILIDRSIDDHYLLSKYRNSIGEVTDDELKVCSYVKKAIDPFYEKIDLLIYIKCSKDKHIERLKNRNKQWDKDAEKYVEMMTSFYEKWISEIKSQKLIDIIEYDNTTNDEMKTVKSLKNLIEQRVIRVIDKKI